MRHYSLQSIEISFGVVSQEPFSKLSPTRICLRTSGSLMMKTKLKRVFVFLLS